MNDRCLFRNVKKMKFKLHFSIQNILATLSMLEENNTPFIEENEEKENVSKETSEKKEMIDVNKLSIFQTKVRIYSILFGFSSMLLLLMLAIVLMIGTKVNNQTKYIADIANPFFIMSSIAFVSMIYILIHNLLLAKEYILNTITYIIENA